MHRDGNDIGGTIPLWISTVTVWARAAGGFRHLSRVRDLNSHDEAPDVILTVTISEALEPHRERVVGQRS